MSDKRAKALRTIDSLQKVIDHPNTGEGERAAAQNRIDALRAKYDIAARPKVTQEQINRDAERIRRQTRMYEEFVRMQQQAEARRKRVEDERRRAEETRRRRQQAQRDWEAKNRLRDPMGRNLTDEEIAEARRDPLGWAAKRDGRTAQEKNQDLQDTYTHKVKPRCAKPASFFDQGGEPRKRNQFEADCVRCGLRLAPGEGHVYKVGSQWMTECCEMVPGPRRKKPGRG